MAVSLISTGVQFPDSSIQTTAAGASGMVLISTTSTTSAAQVDIPLTGSYAFYTILGSNIRGVSVNDYVQYVYTTNNFSTTSNFSFGQGIAWITGLGPTGWDSKNLLSVYQIDSGQAGLILNMTLGNSPTVSNSLNKSVVFTSSGSLRYGGSRVDYSGTGGGEGTGGSAINGIRFYLFGSNMRGTFKLYGMN
jgi:hypothetical protein